MHVNVLLSHLAECYRPTLSEFCPRYCTGKGTSATSCELLGSCLFIEGFVKGPLMCQC